MLTLVIFGMMMTGTAGVTSTRNALTKSPIREVIMATSSLPNSNSKICDNCGSEKVQYRDSRYVSGGLVWRCRHCTNARVRERYHENLEVSRGKGREKAARHKESRARYYQENKERWREYGKRQRSSDAYKEYQEGYKRENSERIKEYYREYYRKNAPRMKEQFHANYLQNADARKVQARGWAKNNPTRRQEITNTARQKRRATLAEVANTLTTVEWEEIKLRFGYRCAYCKEKRKLTRDHITPISAKGPNTVANMAPACRSCNSKKHKGKPLVPVQPLLIA